MTVLNLPLVPLRNGNTKISAKEKEQQIKRVLYMIDNILLVPTNKK